LRQGAGIGLLMKEEAQDDEGPRRNLNPLHLGVSENVVYPIVPNGFAGHYPY